MPFKGSLKGSEAFNALLEVGWLVRLVQGYIE